MKKKVIGFFTMLLVFVLVMAFIAYSQTGKISNISGYSVAVENEDTSTNVYGTILSGIFIGFIFCYAVKFVFESYDRKVKEVSFRKHIDIDLS